MVDVIVQMCYRYAKLDLCVLFVCFGVGEGIGLLGPLLPTENSLKSPRVD